MSPKSPRRATQSPVTDAADNFWPRTLTSIPVSVGVNVGVTVTKRFRSQMPSSCNCCHGYTVGDESVLEVDLGNLAFRVCNLCARDLRAKLKKGMK
jgi:hypothetical protein